MSTEDFKAQAPAEAQAIADRIAAFLVTEQLGGSLSTDLYEIAVHMTAHAWLLGYSQGHTDCVEGTDFE